MIHEIEAIKSSIPASPTEPEQLWVEQWSRQLYVKASAHKETGWGEVLCTAGNDPTSYAEMVRTLSPLVKGKEVSNPTEIWNLLQRYVFSGGTGVTTGAISGIDIAIWDLNARENGVPLYRMLGGERKKISRYVSLSRYRQSDLVPAVRGLLSKGFHSIKLHQSPNDTIVALRNVREALGYDFELMADINCGFELEAARKFATAASRFELKWIEEPIWPPDDYDSIAQINKIMPVAAGENVFTINEFRRLVKLDALSYYQPDISKAGGITAVTEIVKMLKAEGKQVAFHCRPHNGWVTIAASAHIASALAPDSLLETPPNCPPAAFIASSNRCETDIMEPQGPGHGITPIEPLPVLKGGGLLRFHD